MEKNKKDDDILRKANSNVAFYIGVALLIIIVLCFAVCILFPEEVKNFLDLVYPGFGTYIIEGKVIVPKQGFKNCGTTKNKKKMLKIWNDFKGIIIILTVLAVEYGFALVCEEIWHNGNTWDDFRYFLGLDFIIGVCIYFGSRDQKK